jgi:hypothetical protein
MVSLARLNPDTPLAPPLPPLVCHVTTITTPINHRQAAQRKAFVDAAVGALRPLFVADDASPLLSLILHDAGAC